MCRRCGPGRERKIKPVLFEVECPECGRQAPARSIYVAWCDWCGSMIEFKDGKAIGCLTEEKLKISPSMALRNKGENDGRP